MSDLTNEQIKLASAWSGVFEGTGKAVQWIEDVAPNAGEVRNVAPHLLWDLYKARNLSRSLRRVATTPMGVGFFGLSQAGKSHLINTLAANEHGQLETQFGHEQLNFEQHVNPQGGGAEATGLVTRFTRKADPSPDPAFPLELRLFREVEIAIVLVNSWFEEFDHDMPQMGAFQITEAMVASVLPNFEQRAGEGVPGLESEDVAALREYVNERYHGKAKVLDACGYWAKAAKLAPKLSVNDRAELFSVLWGKESKLTDVFRQLTGALDRLGRAETVFASIQALVSKEGDAWVRKNSI
ncbi:MAG TPA: virulence factor SrfC family protein, partial [Comamonas sp.]